MFTATTTHALRALAFLAAQNDGAAVQGKDLARKVKLPAHYLSKVLAVLARAGVVTATRGARGGYRLARRPEKIRLAEIVVPLEGKRARPGCLLRPDKPCSDSVACSAHTAWGTLKSAYATFLDRTTLADIGGAG